MSKKFRCGRLLLTRDGRVKKLELGNGGGTRTCDWTNDRMTFDDVHNQLLAVFSLTNYKCQTYLYDFQRQPLDLQQFKTLSAYINKYGLNRNSTVVYLCTSEVDGQTHNEHVNIASPVVENELESIPEDMLVVSSVEYSFVDASNELMKHIRELIHRNPSEKVFVQLFDDLCLIHSYVFSIIVPLQQQLNDPSNESAVTLYLHNLDHIYQIFDATKALLHQNLDRFRCLKLFSTLRSAFFQLHNNVKIVRSRSMARIKSDMSCLPLSDTESEDEQDRRRAQTRPSASDGKEMAGKHDIFMPLMCLVHRLLDDLTQFHYFPAFREFVQSALETVEQLRSGINLLDTSSICDAKHMLLALRSDFHKKVAEAGIRSSKVPNERDFCRWCKKTRLQMTCLLRSLGRYQMQIKRKN